MNLRYATRCLIALDRQIADLSAELTEVRQQRERERARLRAAGIALLPTTSAAEADLLSALRQARRRRGLLLGDPHFPDVDEATGTDMAAAAGGRDMARALVR